MAGLAAGSTRLRMTPEADVLSIAVRNDSLRATAISVGFVGVDSPGVDIATDSLCVDIASDALRVDIGSAADLPRGGKIRFRATRILPSRAGYSQERRDECDGKDVFDCHDFPPAFNQKYRWQITRLAALIFIKHA
jgi:hypothetical protein